MSVENQPAVRPAGYPDTPELDRMLAARGQSQPAGEFLDWLHNLGYRLCTWDPDAEEFVPSIPDIERLLGRWLGIDPQKCETERRAVLEYARSQH
jgi:hypothetical protein